MAQNATLAQTLHVRAVSASATRLALDLALGGAVAVAAFWFRPFGWLQFMTAGVCFAAYGGWAFAERHLESDVAQLPRVQELFWAGLRGITASAGFLAAVILACSLVAALLGTWIS